jgi:hypothetical protein
VLDLSYIKNLRKELIHVRTNKEVKDMLKALVVLRSKGDSKISQADIIEEMITWYYEFEMKGGSKK